MTAAETIILAALAVIATLLIGTLSLLFSHIKGCEASRSKLMQEHGGVMARLRLLEKDRGDRGDP